MLFLYLFLLEFLLLFLSSQFLARSISKLTYYLFHSREVVAHVIAFLFLPGTIIHELAHVVMAGVLMVPTGEIEFIPEIHEDGVRLGTAEVGKTDPLRRMLIGVAPVIIGLVFILSLLFYVSSEFLKGNSFSFLIYLLLIYVLFVVGNTMFSSRKDLEGSLGVTVLIIGIFIALYLLDFREPFKFFESIVESKLVPYLKNANIFLLIPLLINLVIIFLARVLHPRRVT